MKLARNFSILRSLLLGLTGLSCVTYALLAVLQGRPDPVGWWIPGAVGACAAALIFLAAVMVGRRATQIAMDELHILVNQRAQRHAYWVCLGLFVGVILLAKTGIVDWNTGFAVLGTLMGASYPLLFVFYEWRLG